MRLGYDLRFGTGFQHDLHFGYQYSRDEEDLIRSSNGWGFITMPGGNISTGGVPVFVRAQFLQQGLSSLDSRSSNPNMGRTISR